MKRIQKKMKNVTALSVSMVCLLTICAQGKDHDPDTSFMYGYPLQPMNMKYVKIRSGLLADRLDAHVSGTVPHLIDKLDLHIKAVLWEADNQRGKAVGEKPVPKGGGGLTLLRLVEGVGYTQMYTPDPKLEAWMDNFIEAIEVDVKKTGGSWFGGSLRSVPYYWATGKDKWMKLSEQCVMKAVNQHFDSQGVMTNVPGIWSNNEWDLCRAYQGTGNKKYLDLAVQFADARGGNVKKDSSGYWPKMAPMGLPLEGMTEPGGHSGCFSWFASGQTAVAAMSGREKNAEAVKRIWKNMMDTRAPIMGGMGANGGVEGFGAPYYITRAGYNETCTATGMMFYHHRMFLLTKDGMYFDAAEIALLNAVFAGVSMDGTKFFYPNILETNGKWGFNMQHQKGRWKWWKVVCCPGSISRAVPQVPMLTYTYADDDLYVTLYSDNKTEIPLTGGTVGIDQKTEYPYDGKIALEISPEKNGQEFTLRMRIPGWAREKFMPSKLYEYIDPPEGWKDWELKVNGKTLKPELEKGFAVVKRSWKKGDKVELNLPMPVQFTKASLRRLVAYSGRVAVTRGPLLYCAEEIDNGMRVQKLAMPKKLPNQDQIKFSTIGEGPLKNVKMISMPGVERVDTPEPLDNRKFRVYLTMSLKPYEGKEKPMTINLVPYNTWDNRGDKSMTAWIPRKAEVLPKGPLKWIPASKEKPPVSQVGAGTVVTFENKTSKRVKLYWLDYRGKRVSYGEIEPGATLKKGTYSDATWLIADENDKLLGHFVTGPWEASAVIPKQ